MNQIIKGNESMQMKVRRVLELERQGNGLQRGAFSSPGVAAPGG